MGIIDYTKLYELQDAVLSVVCSTEGDYYLTGETCLNRFYHEERYSDRLSVMPTCDLVSVKSGLKRSIIAFTAGGTNLPWL